MSSWGYAVARYGHPRATGDLDILVYPDLSNAVRVMTVLREFGFPTADLSEDDFVRCGSVVQIGISPLRIDLITSIDGVGVEDAFTGFTVDEFEGLTLNFIGLPQLLRNKRATGRPKDLGDVACLE